MIAMRLLANKHVIAAMIVTPLLAIGGYYAVDLLVKEKPHVAIEGNAYRLIAQSNCRYSSGECDLSNTDVAAKMTIESYNDASVVTLTSSHSLQGVLISVLDDDQADEMPVSMTLMSNDHRRWSTAVDKTVSGATLARLVLSANNTHYYAETTLGFGVYETTFKKDFRQ